MRRAAWMLLLALAFAIPWEYSLDFGPPLGNIARLAALALLLAILLAVFRAGQLRGPGSLLWLVLGLYLWFCCSCFWTIDRAESLHQLRSYAQELMIAWFVWELVDTPRHLRDVMRAYVAGAWLLALLTLGSFAVASTPEQVRFAAASQDPNDMARFLVLAFPLAAALVGSESTRQGKLLAAGYLPFGLLGVLLTASRSGFLAAMVALAGCGVLLFLTRRRAFTVSLYALPAILAGMWLTIPQQTLERVASIPAELERGDLNQRLDIWEAGWQAFVHAPFFGSGAGSFVVAAGLAPIDTAHNTALTIAVEGGIVGLLLATAIVVVSAACVVQLPGPLRIALAAALLALLLSSVVATVQENRATWLLLGLIAAAARLAVEQPASLAAVFPAHAQHAALQALPEPGLPG